jgi:hypothetical protein
MCRYGNSCGGKALKGDTIRKETRNPGTNVMKEKNMIKALSTF